MTQHIVKMSLEHLTQIRAIEDQAHTHPWSDKHLLDIDARFSCNYVLLQENKLIGYYYAQNIVGEVTLLNIAVAPNQQGSGHGKHLLEHLLNEAQQAQAESIWLEVRESNHKAINLYTSLGFNEVTRRFDYYPSKHGREDAIVMSCFL